MCVDFVQLPRSVLMKVPQFRFLHKISGPTFSGAIIALTSDDHTAYLLRG
jgi:hypothetical protein